LIWIKSLHIFRTHFIPILLGFVGILILIGNKISRDHHQIEIVITNKPMNEGETLRSKNVRLMKVHKELVPLSVLYVSDLRSAEGRKIVRPIPKGAPVQWQDLDISLFPSVPAQKVAPGYRALAVAVDDLTSAGSAIRPGDHVDLISIAQLPNEIGATSMTILQNVTVLSVGDSLSRETPGTSSDPYSTVTLMVLPKEVNLIALASKQGELSLSLRNPDDFKTPEDLPMVSTNELIESGFRNSIQSERNRSIEIIRGGKSNKASFMP